MAARLCANENFHRGVVAFAKEDGRAVLTFNRRHFVRLHDSLSGDHCGVIVCTMDPDLNALAQRIDAEIRGAGSLEGKALRIHRPAK